MNRLQTRAPRSRTVAGGLATVLTAALLAGCGAGQISQSADQKPAVNGTGASVGELRLRDVYLQGQQRGDALRPPQRVDLRFAVINDSGVRADELLSVTSEYGDVTLTGERDIPANGLLVVGAPEQLAVPKNEGAGFRRAGDATVTLKREVSNGLLYPFTFTFREAGPVEVEVPVSAGYEAERQGPDSDDGHTVEGAH
ncbi:hypothetical protein LV457_03895 [Mycobacterium sp. MYCO198283]|uniref:hypothetical protein n=1 Tax=Mycobacterium sp. MYCO198283 TaxID=2883505 RepID=UPI001E2EB9E8|nr:hypothetical protein [Mycobacterium sp. MYCO198283]MCG5431432.1 hypothetical protein [Mycobacterium sp. MYCO198283]